MSQENFWLYHTNTITAKDVEINLVPLTYNTFGQATSWKEVAISVNFTNFRTGEKKRILVQDLTDLQAKASVLLKETTNFSQYYGQVKTYDYFFPKESKHYIFDKGGSLASGDNLLFRSYNDRTFFLNNLLIEAYNNFSFKVDNLLVTPKPETILDSLQHPENGDYWIRTNYENALKMYKKVFDWANVVTITSAADYRQTIGVQTETISNTTLWVDIVAEKTFGLPKGSIDYYTLRDKLLDKYFYSLLTEKEKTLFLAEMARRKETSSSGDLFSDISKFLNSSLGFLSTTLGITKWSFEHPDQAVVAAALVITGVDILDVIGEAVAEGTLTEDIAAAIAAEAGLKYPPEVQDVDQFIDNLRTDLPKDVINLLNNPPKQPENVVSTPSGPVSPIEGVTMTKTTQNILFGVFAGVFVLISLPFILKRK